MQLIISYFHEKLGPLIVYFVPEDISEELKEKVLNFLDLDLGESFFEVYLHEDKLKTINHYFEFPSESARGRKETILITLITKKNFKTDSFYDILKMFSKRLQSSREPLLEYCYNVSPDENLISQLKEHRELFTIFSDFYKKLLGTLESTIIGTFLILGINKVGKTTIVERLKKNNFSRNIKPTLTSQMIGLMIETYKLKIIDVSGQKKLRNQWWASTKYPDALIYVYDITEKGERLEETKEEFNKILDRFSETSEHPLSTNTPLLICANKIDLDENLDPQIVQQLFNIKHLNLSYKIQLTSAKTGEGIREGFKWLVTKLMEIT
jgi:small GTP-binding protein